MSGGPQIDRSPTRIRAGCCARFGFSPAARGTEEAEMSEVVATTSAASLTLAHSSLQADRA